MDIFEFSLIQLLSLNPHSPYSNRTGDLLQKDSKKLSVSFGDWRLRSLWTARFRRHSWKMQLESRKLTSELPAKDKRLFQPNTQESNSVSNSSRATKLQDSTSVDISLFHAQNFKTTARVRIISSINRGTGLEASHNTKRKWRPVLGCKLSVKLNTKSEIQHLSKTQSLLPLHQASLYPVSKKSIQRNG